MFCYPLRTVAQIYHNLTFNGYYMINNESIDHYYVINSGRLNNQTIGSSFLRTFAPSHRRTPIPTHRGTVAPSHRRTLSILDNEFRACNLFNQGLVLIFSNTVCNIFCNKNNLS